MLAIVCAFIGDTGEIKYMVPFLKGNTKNCIEGKSCGKYRTNVAEFWLRNQSQEV